MLLIVLLMLPPIVSAQEQSELKDTEPSGIFGIAETAPVVVNGKVRFHVVGVTAYPAERRASEISQRIEALARDTNYSPKTLRIEDAGSYHEIFPGASGKVIIRILEADAKSEGILRTVLADTIGNSIAESINDYRHDRKPAVLTKKALYALGSTIVLIVLMYGVFWGFRRVNNYLERRVKLHMQKLEERSQRIFQGGQLWGILLSALGMLRGLTAILLIYIFTNFALSLFPQTRYTAHRLYQFVVAPLGSIVNGLIDFIPDFLFLVVLYLLTRYGLKLARGVFTAIDQERLKIKGFETDWAWPTYRIVRMGIIIFALVIAYPFIPGSDSAAFKGVSVLLGVLFSLGSTSVISNVIAGYTMTYRRAFRIGDRVKIGDTVGDVSEMRILVTHLRTPKNEEVVIPNSTILNGEVTNYSTMARDQGLILHTTVGIGYDVPWRQVEAMLLLAAENTEGLLREPAPFIRQKSLGDYAVNYELNTYCGDASQMVELYTKMHRNIQDVFNENGVQIMSPAYKADPAEAKIVPKERWYTPPAKDLGQGT
ncbi:mechanosensitive ion channel family protein [Desulfogranum marinum]|uniref:mechanosensitive ion channel family protein n=1 Tax=Desulfogranum marinum TaxID=453220 RepID=UPI0029C8168F|nr:mechanosensitive ion channel family protein [Desulfogranum marinum]